MSNYEPKYSEGAKFRNENTNEEFVILDVSYDKTLCDKVYKMQHTRLKFDIRKVPETVIDKNIQTGDYTKYE